MENIFVFDELRANGVRYFWGVTGTQGVAEAKVCLRRELAMGRDHIPNVDPRIVRVDRFDGDELTVVFRREGKWDAQFEMLVECLIHRSI